MSSGLLIENAAKTAVSIGLTDRRLLAVAHDGEFEVVGYDRISSIQSQPESRWAFRGDTYWLVRTGSIYTVILALLSVIVLASTLLPPVLSFLAVGGTIAAVYLRRDDAELERSGLPETVGTLNDRLDGIEQIRPYKDRVATVATEPWFPWVSSGVIALFALIGLFVVATPLLLGLTLVTIGGIGLVDFAHRRHDFEGPIFIQRHSRDLRIRLIDGRTLHLRLASDDRIDQELSQLTYAVETGLNETRSIDF